LRDPDFGRSPGSFPSSRDFYNGGMTFERLEIGADLGFWPLAAGAVHEFARQQGAPALQLQSVTWLVQAGAHAGLARQALRAVVGSRAFIPPRIVPLPAWLEAPAPGTAAQAEIFAALRGNAWVRDTFGERPGTLWALARDIVQLCDELTWSAAGSPEAFEGQLLASLARHFRLRAARALHETSQLVLQLWRARRSADDGAAQALRILAARAAGASGPLAYVSAVFVMSSDRRAMQRWEDAFLASYAQRAPVLHIVPVIDGPVARRPLLAAAWPELIGRDSDTPIAARADAVRASSELPSLALSVIAVTTLEEEATAVARQVLDWRSLGVESIGVVALDRLTARRVRALLERADVNVRDETGWKLSTTSAAAGVMRWFDLVIDDLYWRDLLDWLKSPFTLAQRPDKDAEVLVIERRLRRAGVVQGARALRRILAEEASGLPDDHIAGARAVLALIEEQAERTRRAGPTLAAHARALQGVLEALGMRAALAADRVGAAVLGEVAALAQELAGVSERATLADFHALLASRFEETAFVDTAVDSPVTMVSLAATALRPFDAALLVGASAEHLPSKPADLLFMSSAVRTELGLEGPGEAIRAQTAALAGLISSTPRVVATWRTQRGDEPLALSPLLERLEFVVRRAHGVELVVPYASTSWAVTARGVERPAPSAPGLLPLRVSASHAQSLVTCAYQFYARRMLGVAELEDVIELPEKREFGEVLHEVLRRFHLEWGAVDFSTVDPELLRNSLAEHGRAVFGPQVERAPGLLAFHRRFERLIDGYVGWTRARAADGWRWAASEEPLAQSLQLAEGHEVELVGRVDRIDRHTDGRLAVLDYKARAVDPLRRALRDAGEDVQLPFYGLLLTHRAENTNEISASYVSLDRPTQDRTGVQPIAPPQKFEPLVREVGERLRVDLGRIASGAPLPAIGIESACEFCEMRGLCRRDHWRQP
jgi:ATP-dependent helicase/nuclease subunit B